MREFWLLMTESPEAQGIYDTKQGIFVDAWFCNDADWRGFEGFMKHLGVVVNTCPESKRKKLEKQFRQYLKEQFGDFE